MHPTPAKSRFLLSNNFFFTIRVLPDITSAECDVMQLSQQFTCTPAQRLPYTCTQHSIFLFRKSKPFSYVRCMRK